MSFFSSNNCGCGCNDGNDTILWFIILFLLIFCNNSLGIGSNGCGCGNNSCGNNSCSECC